MRVDSKRATNKSTVFLYKCVYVYVYYVSYLKNNRHKPDINILPTPFPTGKIVETAV